MPRSVISVFSTPAVRSSIHLKPMAVISTDAAHGAMSAHRVSLAPREPLVEQLGEAQGQHHRQRDHADGPHHGGGDDGAEVRLVEQLAVLVQARPARTKPLTLIFRNEVRTIS